MTQKTKLEELFLIQFAITEEGMDSVLKDEELKTAFLNFLQGAIVLRRVKGASVSIG